MRGAREGLSLIAAAAAQPRRVYVLLLMRPSVSVVPIFSQTGQMAAKQTLHPINLRHVLHLMISTPSVVQKQLGH